MKKRKYGWQPELPDQRDFVYKVINPRAKLKSIDLRTTCKMPAVRGQGDLGSCTANGWAEVLDFNMLNKHASKIDLTALPFSRLFIYYNERVLEGTIKEDSGAYIRDGIKSIAAQGACSEKTWPYSTSMATVAKKPSAAAYKEALQFKAVKYYRVDNSNKSAIVDALVSGYPVIHGFTVYESFESDKVARTGVVPMPGKKEQVLGGHCTVIFGYDLGTDRFICLNSWGLSFGQKGWYTIPAAYLTNTNLADDFWVCNTIL